MKLNICYKNLVYQRDFENISPCATPQSNFKLQDIKNLDNLCDNDECETIEVVDVLNYFVADEVAKMLVHFVAKLKRGGQLLVTFVDTYEVGRRVFSGIMSPEETNSVLYDGEQRCALFMNHLKKFLVSLQTKLVKCRLDGYNCIIVVEKL
jgi:hypothetical protein